MARDQVQVTCPAGAWTQLTNADVTSITFQAQEGDVFIRFTTDATTPTEAAGIVYGVTPGNRQGELNRSILDLTNLSGADRVWAKPLDVSRAAVVYVDHA